MNALKFSLLQRLLFLLIGILYHLPVFAQLTPCKAEWDMNGDDEKRREDQKSMLPTETKSGQTWEIPVRFTVFQKDDGSGWISPITEPYLDQYLLDLNSALDGGPNTYHFFRCGAINFVNSTQLYEGSLLASNYSYVKGMLNIYMYDHSNNGVFSSANFPWMSLPNVVYLTAGSNATTGDISADIEYGSAIHEVGHTLGLLHTFGFPTQYIYPVTLDQIDHPYLGALPRELVIRQLDLTKNFPDFNYDEGGDGIEDTPAGCNDNSFQFPSPNPAPGCQDNNPMTYCPSGCKWDYGNCEYIGDYVDYNLDPITDPDGILVKNYMSYTGRCREAFTSGQIEVGDLYMDLFLDGYYAENHCNALSGRVELEGTGVGLDRVRLKIEPILDVNYYTQALTGPNGSFAGTLPEPALNNQVRADVRRYKIGGVDSYDNDWTSGVTTFDAVAISKHILGLDYLDNGYKMLAADANRSNTITTFDIVEIRKLILGLYDKLPAYDQPWRFIPEAMTHVPNTAFLQVDFDGVGIDDPFNSTALNFGTQQISALDYTSPNWVFFMKGGGGYNGFDAVKLGNVAGSITGLIAPGGECPGQVTLAVPNTAIAANKYVTVKVKAYDFQSIMAIQMGFHASSNDFEMISASSTKLSDFAKESNFGGLSNQKENIKVVWLKDDTNYPAFTNGEFAYTFVLKTKKYISNLSQSLYLDDTVLETYVIGSEGCKENASMELGLEISDSFDGGSNERNMVETSENSGEQLLCVPNPASDHATVLFDSYVESDGEITIFDASGKQLHQQITPLYVGRNVIGLDNFASLPSGILLIRMTSQNGPHMVTIMKK